MDFKEYLNKKYEECIKEAPIDPSDSEEIQKNYK